MLIRGCAALALIGALSGLPAAAFAQQMPQAPDGTSINEPPAAGAQAAVDACGNSPETAFGETNQGGEPVTINDANPKDAGIAQQRENLSSVSGMVVNTAGNLVLLEMLPEAAAGTATATSPDKTMAVIRLPDGCTVSVANGTHVEATGVPTTAGILEAQTVQVSG